MDIVLVGLSHKTAPVEIRERTAFSDEAAAQASDALRRRGLAENLILSTCNRVEILGQHRQPQQAWSLIEEYLQQRSSPHSPLSQYLYRLHGPEAVRHLFRVAGSLDSLVVGEAQILGQLKQAYANAQRAGVSGRYLDTLLPQAFHVAKRIRSETRIGQAAVSIGSVSVELARKIFGDLEGHSALLVGAGRMAELAAESLMHNGILTLRVTNRTDSSARKLAARMGGRAVPFADLDRQLSLVDVVLVSTKASEYLLRPSSIKSILHQRRNRPLFIIDIAVPRNVDPSVHDIDNVFLFDIDDLRNVADANLLEREKAAVDAEAIIDAELQRYWERRMTEKVGPLIQAMRQRFEELCLQDFDEISPRLSEKDRARLKSELRKSAHRLAHPIISEIKRSARRRLSRREVDWIRRVFKLDVDL